MCIANFGSALHKSNQAIDFLGNKQIDLRVHPQFFRLSHNLGKRYAEDQKRKVQKLFIHQILSPFAKCNPRPRSSSLLTPLSLLLTILSSLLTILSSLAQRRVGICERAESLQAAIHAQVSSGDERGIRTRQPQNGVSDFFRPSDSSQWMTIC